MFRLIHDICLIIKQHIKTDVKLFLDFLHHLLDHVFGTGRIPILLVNLEYNCDNNIAFKNTTQEIHDLLMNNCHKTFELMGNLFQKFVRLVCQRFKNLKDQELVEYLTDMVITTSETLKFKTSLFPLFQCKYIFHMEKTQEYALAFQSAENMVYHHKTPQEMEVSVKYFVNAKRKLLNHNPTIDLPSLNSNDITFKKWEIIYYRSYRELSDARQKSAEELLKEGQNLRDTILLKIELASVYFGRNTDLSKGIGYCSEALKSLQGQTESVKAYVHFWTGLLKWSVMRQNLAKEVKNDPIKKPDGNRDDNLGDTASSVYGKVLNLEEFEEIFDHFKYCHQLLDQVQVESFDLINNEVFESIRAILIEIFDLLYELPKQPKTLLDNIWPLLDKGYYDHIKEILEFYEKSKEITEETYEGCLLKAEVKLLKGNFLLTSGLSYDTEGPLEVLWNSVKSSQRVLCYYQKNQPVNLESIHLMFKNFNIAAKARQRIVQTLMNIGLGKEMRLYSKMNIESATEACLLPQLCAHLFTSIEVDLSLIHI